MCSSELKGGGGFFPFVIFSIRQHKCKQKTGLIKINYVGISFKLYVHFRVLIKVLK